MSRIVNAIRGFRVAFDGVIWDNKNGPNREVRATQPGPHHLIDYTERGYSS